MILVSLPNSVTMDYHFLAFNRVSSVCMSVCVNLERMFAVVYPLKTLRGKGIMIPASLAFALAYNLPKVGSINGLTHVGSILELKVH